MPSRNRTLLAAVLVLLTLAVLVYSILLGGPIGVVLPVAAYLLLSAAALRVHEGDLSFRPAVVWIVVGVLVAYGATVGEVLVSVLVAAVVYLVAWVTDPGRERSIN